MSTQMQLYTGATEGYFSSEQVQELDKKLDGRLVSDRKGGFGRKLKYLEGHDAIDQANRIFGYGNWAYKPVSVEQIVLIDPLSGEAVGIEYKALVELTVRGAIAPIVDIGSQPVATWNVEDQIMQRRLKAANGGKVDESEFSLIEKREARAVITEAHEQAKKGAMTDGMKRCLRAYGSQFGNGLYGDGHVDLDAPVQGNRTVVESRPQQQAHQPCQLNAVKSAQEATSSEQPPVKPSTPQQSAWIAKAAEKLQRGIAVPATFEDAERLIRDLNDEIMRGKQNRVLTDSELNELRTAFAITYSIDGLEVEKRFALWIASTFQATTTPEKLTYAQGEAVKRLLDEAMQQSVQQAS